MKLSSFKTGLVEGIRNLFNDLNIPVNPITELKESPENILKETFNPENESFKLIEAVYPYGLVDDGAFENVRDIKLDDIREKYEAIAVFGVKLKKRDNNLLPTRKIFADITRAFNREFKYTPVIIVFKYQDFITIASSERSEYIQKWREGEKVGKITLLRDINIENTHTGHLKILEGLKIPVNGKNAINSFVSLHKHWQEVFDVSILNKKFYKELSNWYFWAMDKVEFPDDAEKREDIRNATNLIRLITRIIFIWFIKEKNLVPEKLFSKDEVNDIITDFNKNKKSGNYYRAILQNLFFGTLNQKMGERKFAKDGGHEDRETNREEYGVKTLWRYGSLFKISQQEAEKLFKDIPFLNGGLFDCLDKENEKNRTIYVDGFSRNPEKQAFVPDYLFFGEETEVDLNEIYGTKNKKYCAEGLINILNSYKFTIAENTPTEEDVALDPELLGKVFENLLASYNPETKTTARKQTGSFYTPREIVNYMVDESLIAYLKTKLDDETEETDQLLHRLFKHNDDQPFEDKQTVLRIIRAFDEIKILDPAVGSGAFPMGVLNKVVHVLSKLDINKDDSEWQELQLKKVDRKMAETTDRAELKELDKLRDDIIKAFTDNEADYPRKLYLIENCIYGVDIQPIAIQICKLRFFISLIVDQKVDRRKDNHGIRPLPNLETKFVAANTLIGLEKPDQAGLSDIFIEQDKKKLLKVRHEHFSAKTRTEKLNCIKKDKEIRKQIAKVLIDNYYKATDANKIADFDLYDQNKSSDWFDPEWMFGIKDGFDVVIGNPPYIDSETMVKLFPGLRDILKKYYITAKGNWDIYIPFYEVAYNLLKSNNAILSYITPNKWLAAPYGKTLREFFEKDISHVVNCSKIKVFEAGNSPLIIFVQKGSNTDSVLISEFSPEWKAMDIDSYPKNHLNIYNWGVLLSPHLNILLSLNSIQRVIGDDFSVENPFSTSEAYEIEKIVEDAKVFDDCFKLLTTGSIDPYISMWGVKTTSYLKSKYIFPVIKSSVLKKHFPRRFAQQSCKKIILSGMRHFEAYFDSEGEFLASKSTIMIKNISDNQSGYFLTAILNSNLIKFYIKESYSSMGIDGGINFSKDMVAMIPLKTEPSKVKKTAEIVAEIISAKKQDIFANTTDLEKQIDKMVYELYGLTEEEIRIVEGGE